MKLVITGGAGFIYSHVAKYFVQQGFDVTIADHFDMQGKGRNLEGIFDKVGILVGDLRFGEMAHRIAALRPDYIVHAAAYTHVDDAIAQPQKFALNNVMGTTNLLHALFLSGHVPQKIVAVSTDEVYGSTPPGMAFTEETPFKPSNAYSASKVGVEAMCHAFWVTHKFPVVIVRPCNTYAERQFPNKVIPRFVQQAINRQKLTVYNDGRGARDWLHASDHARGIHTLLSDGLPGEAYNLGANEEHSDRDIAERILDILGISHDMISYMPGRPGHDKRYMMDTTRIRTLGWTPVVPFETAFPATVRWNADHLDWWENDEVHYGTAR